MAALAPSRRWLLRPPTYLDTATIDLAGAVPGRLLVATLAARSSSGSPSTPSGWTMIGPTLGGSGTSSPSLTVWARVATGTEGSVSFWPGSFDANKMLAVEEYAVSLPRDLATLGGSVNDPGATTGTVCALSPSAVSALSVLWLPAVAVRDVISSPTQTAPGYGPGRWETNTVADATPNVVWLSTESARISDSSEPAASFSWTGAQRFRGRMTGLEVNLDLRVNDLGTWKVARSLSARDGSGWRAARELHERTGAGWRRVW